MMALSVALLVGAPAASMAYTDTEIDVKIAALGRDMDAGWLVLCGACLSPCS